MYMYNLWSPAACAQMDIYTHGFWVCLLFPTLTENGILGEPLEILFLVAHQINLWLQQLRQRIGIGR